MESNRKCFKCGCSPAKDGVKLFRFPNPGVKNLIRCLFWAKYVLPEKDYSSISFQKKLHNEHRMLCQRHFRPDAFMDDAKTKLIRSAIPCDVQLALRTYMPVGHSQQNLPLGDISNLQKPETAHKLLAKDNEPIAGPSHVHIKMQENVKPIEQDQKTEIIAKKCRKYMLKVCQLRNRIKRMKQKDIIKEVSEDAAVQKLSKKITPSFALLLQGQIRNFDKKLTGRRWSTEEKITALRIYKRSPTCYRLLRRMFPLPSMSTLKTMLRRLPFGVGINEPTFKVLSKFIKRNDPKENFYSLLFDEMSIKKNVNYNSKDDIIEGYQDHGTQGRSPNIAAYALVFMISGIRQKFKQPIAHYFSGGCTTADRLAVLIKEVLHKCFEVGINVVATVCDMDGVNRRALTILGSTIENPSIKVQNKEIFTFCDTPHLLKCFRNLFMKYNIEIETDISSEGKVGKGVAKWSHIENFFEVDSTNPHFVYAPVLSKEHLQPNSKQKMKVNLAAQVFSFSVAGGMFSRIAKGSIPPEAAVTANLVCDMDKLFDLLNADHSDLRRGKKYSTNWSRTSPHKEFLIQMKKKIDSMKYIGSTRRPPSQDGWLITINAFMKVMELLNKNKMYTLATRRIQQDPLENLFGMIRANCGSNTNPTCGQFVAGLKTAVLSNLAHMGTKGNCEEDNNVIMNNFKSFLKSRVIAQPTLTESEIELEGLPILNENIDEDDEEIQACAYVCGFIIKKINKTCQQCHKILLCKDPEPIHMFTEFREYNEMKKSLNYVTKPTVVCVEGCATILNKILNEKPYINNIKVNIIEAIKSKINFDFLNGCQIHKDFNMEHIVNSVFIICTKRFCIIKNRTFTQEASAAAIRRKMKIITHQ